MAEGGRCDLIPILEAALESVCALNWPSASEPIRSRGSIKLPRENQLCGVYNASTVPPTCSVGEAARLESVYTEFLRNHKNLSAAFTENSPLPHEMRRQ
jgi:hypothetical protein